MSTEAEFTCCRFTNLAAMFWHRVAETPNLEAYRYPTADESWRSMTWAETGDRVRRLAGGLLALGLEREQRCGIACNTRVEWVLADLAILCAGGATTTVYPSNTADEGAYILTDSDTRLIFTENQEQLDKLKAHRQELGHVRRVIAIDPVDEDVDGDDSWVISMARLEDLGREYLAAHPDALSEIADTLQPEMLATLIYTSGTTGQPKGVRLTHECWCYVGEASNAMGFLTVDDLTYLWLPLSHSFGKALMSIQLAVGLPAAVDGRIPKLVDNLAVVKPTWMGAAPRIFEKVYNRIIGGAKQAGGLKYKLFKWSLGVGLRASRENRAGRQPNGLLGLQARFADKLVFSKVRARFGGRLRFFISGSAPLSMDIAEFFHATGITILEGYGLTETSGPSHFNRPNDFRLGTVGKPLPGTEQKIAPEDGEILLRGPGVMRGYHNLPEITAEVLTADGWLKTGDIGEIDADGFLRITDRKKDLIKTSGGKYVAPQHVEGKFKALCPVASQIIVHGDRRNFCTALVTLDEEAITAWAMDHGLAGRTYEELTRSDKVRALVQSYIDQLNTELPSYETIKRFAILPRDLSVEDGDLTPSLKVKRKHVEQKYMELLDGMYKEALESV